LGTPNPRQSLKLTHLERVCFLHIPKTAGTSLRLWLEDLFDVSACCPIYHQIELEQQHPSELERYEFFSGHFGWQFAKRLSCGHAITFLRNPADRTISKLRYFRNFTPEQNCTYRDRTWVKGWVLDLLNNASNEEIVTMPRFVNEGNEQTRQLSDLGTPTLGEDDLRAATRNLCALDAFGLVEDMDRSILLLCDQLGLPVRSMEIRANVTTESDTSPAPSQRELRAARVSNVYDDELYRAAERRLNGLWIHRLERHGLIDDFAGRARLIEHIDKNFRLTERGVRRLSALSVDPSHGMVADGWKGRFLYNPIGRWIRWSHTRRPCLWLPIDRRLSRDLRVDIAYTSDTTLRDGVTIEIDGEPVQTDRSYELWPEDQNHHLVLSASIPPCDGSPQYTEVAFRFPIAATERASMALSRIAVTEGAN
jgi:hypothetical protein